MQFFVEQMHFELLMIENVDFRAQKSMFLNYLLRITQKPYVVAKKASKKK